MDNSNRNRLLIIGLTGPLGSGCTSIGKFLSGLEYKSQPSIEELLQIQCAELNDLNDKISVTYEKIFGEKNKIKNYLSKRLGPSKQSWNNKAETNHIQDHEIEINIHYSELKDLLIKREIYITLKQFLESNCFNRNNFNEHDKKVFGANPFFYISFTTIIIKLALEEYNKEGGENKFRNYFFEKAQTAESSDLSDIYDLFFCRFLNFLKIESDYKKVLKSVNNILRVRVYESLRFRDNSDTISDAALDLQNKTSESIRQFYVSLYDIFSKTSNFLEKNRIFVSNAGLLVSRVFSEILQDWGDNIRSTGNPFLILKDQKDCSENSLFKLSHEINLIIKALRFRNRYLDESFHYLKNQCQSDFLTVLECIRNPYEIEFFRDRYSEFYLISLSADKETRRARVNNFCDKRDLRDQGGNIGFLCRHKLDVRSSVFLSDIAITNNYTGKNSFFDKFLRFFSLIRNPGCIPPNNNELYMHIAYSHSLKSNCISRKVGAVIVGPQGYIIGAGWNDAGEGQIGCGLRTKHDLLSIPSIPLTSSKDDDNKFKKYIQDHKMTYICYKDVMSVLHTENKLKKFAQTCDGECLKRIGSELGIKRLEYCRALHAEENAMLQSSKIGGIPIYGGTLYTTTYPCELCAKKLYHVGIRTLFYTEPYPESVSDRVIFEDGTRIIERIAFEGVKSFSYFKLFKPMLDKKDIL